MGIFKCLELVCLVRIKLPNVSGFWRKLSWKNCVFRGLRDEFLLCYGNVMENLWWVTNLWKWNAIIFTQIYEADTNIKEIVEKKIPKLVQAKCFNCPVNVSVIVFASKRFWRERDCVICERSPTEKRKVFSFLYQKENTFL